MTVTAPAAAPALLEASGLDVRYGVARALFGVSLTAAEGQTVALLGPNGAGKSTFARAVSALIPIASGSVRFDGHDITGWAPHRVRRAGIVHIPEGRGIFPGLTVDENVRMSVRRVGTKDERRAGIDRAFTLFPVLGQRRAQRAASLSGGEQQMLAMARALAVAPKLVIADEMSLGLAPLIVDEVFEGIDAARRGGATVVLIEQFVHRALALADTAVILRQGRVVWSGAAATAEHEVLERYLGEADAL